jgi:hypothetical protein
MAALKESMGRAKLRDPVRRRIGKPEKGSGKAASVAPEANLAPGRRQVGATHRGGTATGSRTKRTGDFVVRLLKRRRGLCDYRRLMMPPVTSHSDCNRNNNGASE